MILALQRFLFPIQMIIIRDHRAMFVFTIVSLWEIRKEVEIYPYVVHYRNWPLPLGYHPNYFLDPPSYDHGIVWKELPMKSRNVQTKFSALKSI